MNKLIEKRSSATVSLIFKRLEVFQWVLDSVQFFILNSNLELISKNWLFLNFCNVFLFETVNTVTPFMNRLLYCLTKTKRCAPRLVGFSVIIFIVFTIAWTRKHSVFTSFVKFKKERGSWGFRRTCSCWGKKRRMLSSFWWSFPGALLVFGSFLWKDYGCIFSEFCSQICELSKLNNFSQDFSEPNVCCNTTETSILSKVTSIRLPGNTYFFREKNNRNYDFLTILLKMWNGLAWRLTFQQSSKL